MLSLQQTWAVYAYLARYARVPPSEIDRLLPIEAWRLFKETEKIILAESAPLRGK